MLMHKVVITKNELQTQTLTVPPWEVPVLQAVHGGAEEVQLVDEVEVEGRDMPDPVDEMERLANRYGSDEDSPVPFVAQVYGQHAPGLQNLGRMMKQSQRKSRKPSAGEGEGEKGEAAQSA